MRLLIPGLIVFLWMPNVIAKSTNGQQFRIESEVSFAEQEHVASRNLTLFSNGYVHDFMTTSADENPADEPETIVIWDRLRQELVLLDIQRELKTTLSHEEILRFNAALMARGAFHYVHPDKKLRFQHTTSSSELQQRLNVA